MTFKFDGYNWVVRLTKGEKLIENLTKLVKDEGLESAWISGLGAVNWVELGFYDLAAKKYIWKHFDGLREITGIHGNIAWEGEEPIFHMHGTFSDHDFQTIGGHIKDLEAGGTVEILLHRWKQGKLTRKFDPDTGLKLLEL